MDSYSNLVSKILKIDVLAHAAKEITDKESDPKRTSLNLVSPNWQTLLEEHQDFKHARFHSKRKPYSTETYFDYEKAKDTVFNITLAANCTFYQMNEETVKSDSKQKNWILLNNSEPLQRVARAMIRDSKSHIPISENHKFSMKNCGNLICNYCEESLQHFSERGHIVKQSSQPCIAFTKVFDGKNIYNRFYSQLEGSFKNEPFVAILHLKINSRYMYADKNAGGQKVYRIGGAITNMVAFDKAKLDLVQTINLGTIKPMLPVDCAHSIEDKLENIKEELLRKCANDNVFNETLDDIIGIQHPGVYEDRLDDKTANKRPNVFEDNFDELSTDKPLKKKPRVDESTLQLN